MSHMDLQRYRAEMLKEWRAWAERVARAVKRILPKSEVYVLGSVVRGDYTGGSDIDILIVSNRIPEGLLKRAELKRSIEETANLPITHQIQIHLTRRSEADNYIRRAGKDIIKLW